MKCLLNLMKGASLAAALFIFPACRESADAMVDRVFDVALSRYTSMDEALTPLTLPRTAQADSLVLCKPSWWTSGFYPGSLWYIYLKTSDPGILALAEKNTRKVYAETQAARSHDIGFVTNCSYGNALRFTADTIWRQPVIDAARALCRRYSPVTGAIRSWDFSRGGKTWLYPVIIDNMMNLELLMEAYRLSGTDSLRAIAVAHAHTTLNNHFRSDCSSYHVVDFDPADGSVRSKCTLQGYSDDSAWARGQSWGLYGYTMMFRESGEKVFLDVAEKIAAFIIPRLPADGIPYWDYDAPDIPDAPRDASAAAIMASALLELSAYTENKGSAQLYRRTALKQLRTLSGPGYLAASGENCNFLLKHCVGNLPAGSEVDVPLSYADYYFLEALLRLRGLL